MAKAVVVVMEIDGATNASTDGRLLVTDAAAASMPANAAAAAAVGRLTIVVLASSRINRRMTDTAVPDGAGWRGMDDDETKEH